MRNIIIIIAVAFTALNAVAQNQLHLSNYMLHQPFFNPAAIGTYSELNGAIVAKEQWVGFNGAPSVKGLNINSPVSESGNVSFTLMNDVVGIHNKSNINLAYAHRLKINTSSAFSFGLGTSLIAAKSNYALIDPTVENDPQLIGNSGSKVAPNFNVGAYYFTHKYYVGIAVPELLKNDIYNSQGGYQMSTSFDASNLHLYINSGYAFTLNEKLKLNVSTLIKSVANSPIQIDLNTQLEFNNKFGVGASFRTSNILVGLVNFRINETLKIGYAYDYNMTALKNYSSGSHEIMVIFQRAKSNPAYLESPRF